MASVWESILAWIRRLTGRDPAALPAPKPAEAAEDVPKQALPELPAAFQRASPKEGSPPKGSGGSLEADLDTDDRMALPENPMESVSIRELLPRARALRGASDWESGQNAPAATAGEVRHSLELLLHELESSASSREDRRFYQQLALVTRARDPKLPPYPRVATELARMVDDPNVQVRSLVKLIERDPALIRAVWLQASSAAHSQPPRTLAAAVSRLGTDALWRIAMSTVLRATAVQVKGFEDEVAAIQEHGFIASDVAVFITGDRRGPPFLAGLLNSVGKLVIYNAAKADRNGAKPSRSVVERMIKQHHSSFGMLVGTAWKLDEKVIQAIGHHHGSSRPPAGVDKELCASVAKACLVSEAILQVANDESPVAVGTLARQCSGEDEVQSLLSVAGLAWCIFHIGDQPPAPESKRPVSPRAPGARAAPSPDGPSEEEPVRRSSSSERPRRRRDASERRTRRSDEEPERKRRRRSEGERTERRSRREREEGRPRRRRSRSSGRSDSSES